MDAVPESIVELPLSVIERGYFQPREYFSAEAMEATKRSIQEKGQKYPVVVRAIGPGNPLYDPSWTETHYELADGERRFRCCKELGFAKLKALIRDLSDEEMLDYTLTTNDSLPLNPIEKATVFSRLAKEFGKSQAEIAASFHLKQQQVSEYIRLLELPKPVQELTARAVISVRHARELLKIEDKQRIVEVARQIQDQGISTRALTRIIGNKEKIEGKRRKPGPEDAKSSFHFDTERKSDGSGPGIGGTLGSLPPLSGFAWLERGHARVLPKPVYARLAEWSQYHWGAGGARPEIWLVRLELSLVAGIAAGIASLWVPPVALAGLGGAAMALLAFLYLR